MDLLKTEKERLTTDEIESYIQEHKAEVVRCANLWAYYRGKNATILEKKSPDPNNPDNRTPVPYGRKIVTTFTGYAYRPKFITYKVDDAARQPYMDQLTMTFDLSREHIKTERAGRNTAIYGYAYEVLYVAGVNRKTPDLPVQAEPHFFAVDPKEIILLHDYSPEPLKQLAIRYYRINDDWYKVELYTRETVTVYDRKQKRGSMGLGTKWVYTMLGEYPNFFSDIPVVPYYFGDERLGIIEPVLPLIDDYDLLMSDSFNEFDRFANAYLLLKKFALSSPEMKKEPGAVSRALALIKRRRVFENLDDTSDVKFLTKDIPADFVTFMAKLVKDQVHEQSHVPDFRELATGDLSGAAIKRLMFDFENVVASAEADFDEGLLDRIQLINAIYGKTGRIVDDIQSIVITHKRNMPDDLKEAAETAVQLKAAGFSNWLIADSMPDNIVPDVEEELQRQEEERKSMFGDVDEGLPPSGDGDRTEEMIAEETR